MSDTATAKVPEGSIPDELATRSALRIVGGQDQLDALKRDAATFIPPAELAQYNEWLKNPNTRADTVKLLMQERDNHARVKAVEAPTNVRDYKTLERRAMNGDAKAQQLIANLDVSTITVHPSR